VYFVLAANIHLHGTAYEAVLFTNAARAVPKTLSPKLELHQDKGDYTQLKQSLALTESLARLYKVSSDLEKR